MTLGILGGMSWVSTLEYYRLINEGYQKVNGKQHSPNLLISSVNFQKIIDFQVKNNWDGAGELLSQKAKCLEQGGAKAILIASNTMHRVLEAVSSEISIPILNIFDAVADALKAHGIRQMGLLGTRYTMNDPFYRDEYRKRGISVVVPHTDDAAHINRIIFHELIHGKVSDNAIIAAKQITDRLFAKEVGGVVLGCTELSLLYADHKNDEARPIFDTTQLHVEMALKWLAHQPN